MDAFDGIIDINRLQFVCKPDPAAYHRALRIANFDRPEECVLLDDSVANVRTAARLGFQTVLVSESSPPDYFGISIPDIYHLPKVLPHLQIESDTEHIGSGNQ